MKALPIWMLAAAAALVLTTECRLWRRTNLSLGLRTLAAACSRRAPLYRDLATPNHLAAACAASSASCFASLAQATMPSGRSSSALKPRSFLA